jgi:hypothetical protein
MGLFEDDKLVGNNWNDLIDKGIMEIRLFEHLISLP